MKRVCEGQESTQAVEYIDPDSIVYMICFPDEERELKESHECTKRTHDSQ